MGIIAIISAIIYAVAIIAIYHNIYNFGKSEKIKFIIASGIIVLLITIVLVWISSINIEAGNNFQNYEEYFKMTKKIAILLFAPINTIICVPYIGNLLNKYTEKRIDRDKLNKKLIVVLIVLVIIGVFEVGYIRDFQLLGTISKA